MSIQKKNGKYYAVVYTGCLNGKSQHEWSQSFTNRKLCRQEEIKMQEAVAKNGNIPRIKSGFSALADSWLAMRKKTVATSTYRMNKQYYDIYIKKYFAGYSVKEITPVVVQNFFLTLDHAPATTNKVISILSLMFKYGISLNMAYYNPCDAIKRQTVVRKKRITWTEAQISQFLSCDFVKLDTAYIPLMILFTTGMRPGEVCGLRWCDLKKDHFAPAYGRSRYREETDLKNNKAHDDVYIPNYVIKALKEHRKRMLPLFVSNGVKFTEESPIFALEPDMRGITPTFLYKNFIKLVDRTDLPKVTLYEAGRHSFGTNLMRKGVNPKEVAELMRHTSVKTTLDNYTHVSAREKKKQIAAYGINIS